MATTTNDVDTLAASGAKPQKRPIDPFVMLNEIDVDKIADIDRLKEFIYLCDAALGFLDDEFPLDDETRALVDLPDNLFEAKLTNRTPLSKKLASARRYRNRRQHILNKKRKADDNRVAKVITKKMAYSQKSRTGREKRKYHTDNHVSEGLKREGRWNGIGTPYSEWMKPASDKNSAEMRALATEWAKPAPKAQYVVEYWNREKEKTETVDSDLYTIRFCREINKLLRGNEN